MMSSGINLVMTVIGFAVSTMFIVFVCTRLICARIQLRNSRRSFTLGSRSNFSILERGLNGVEPVMVASFPTKKYSDDFFSSAENTQCTVCLADYHKEDVLRILPSCEHSFHATCIDIWLQQHSTCPVCRISLRGVPEKKRLMRPLPSSAAQYHHAERSFTTHPYHCMTGHGFSSRSNDNHAMNRNHDAHFLPQDLPEETGTDLCPVHGCSQVTNICLVHGCNQVMKDPRSKGVESHQIGE